MRKTHRLPPTKQAPSCSTRLRSQEAMGSPCAWRAIARSSASSGKVQRYFAALFLVKSLPPPTTRSASTTTWAGGHCRQALLSSNGLFEEASTRSPQSRQSRHPSPRARPSGGARSALPAPCSRGGAAALGRPSRQPPRRRCPLLRPGSAVT